MKTYALYIKSFIALAAILLSQSCNVIKPDKKPNPTTNNKVQPIVKPDTIVKYDTISIGKYEKRVDKIYTYEGKTIKKDSVTTIVNLTQKRIDSLNNLSNAIADSISKNIPEQIQKVHGKKINYNIAILMPFMTESARTAENEAKSLRATEFYEGALLALDTLRRENVNLNIHVYDTRDNDTTLATILALEKVQSADLIIGPMTTNELRTVAQYAMEKEIPLLSPLNPRFVLESASPNFLQLSPSLNTQMQYVFKHVQDKFPRRNINYIIAGTKNDSASVMQIAEAYKVFSNNTNAKFKTYLSTTTQFSNEEFAKLIDKTAYNVIIAPTLYETFVFSLVSSLTTAGSANTTTVNPNARSSNEYMLVGLSQWRYFESINFEYYDKLNLHIPSELYLDFTQSSTQRLKENYFNNYGMAPREFAFIGFDVMLFAGRMLHKHGTGFIEKLPQEKFVGRHTTFQFEPVYIEQAIMPSTENLKIRQADYYENKYINFLKFEEYTLKKTN